MSGFDEAARDVRADADQAEFWPVAGAQVPVAMHRAGFRYGGAPVLDGVTLTVAPGAFKVITGENGAGKSTLLRLVLGELKPTAGEVRLFGRDPMRFHDWTRVGYVPQRTVATYGQFPASVEEVVCANLYARARRMLPFGRGERARAREALEAVGLAGFGSRMLGELSGGQLQRVLLARALVGRPELLVLDEPTSGLDADAAARFCELLGDLRRRDPRLAVLMVTHDLGRLGRLGAEVLRLEGGTLACAAPAPARPRPGGSTAR